MTERMFVQTPDYAGGIETIRRGNAAEAAVLAALTGAGFHVLVPFGEGLPFDLVVVGSDERMLRIQVKSGRVRDGCIEFNSSSTDHGRRQRPYRGLADLIAVYVSSIGRTFILPVDACPSFRGYLRLDPPRNNQRRGVRLAEDYSFERWLHSYRDPVAA